MCLPRRERFSLWRKCLLAGAALVMPAALARADDPAMARPASPRSAQPPVVAQPAAAVQPVPQAQPAPDAQSSVPIAETAPATSTPGQSPEQEQTTSDAPRVPFYSRLWGALASEPDEGDDQFQAAVIPASYSQASRRAAGRNGEMPTFQPGGYFRTSGGFFRLARQPAPLQPQQPLAAAAPPVSALEPLQPTQPLSALGMFGQGGIMSALSALPADRAPIAQSIAPVASATSAQALTSNARPDLAQAIADEVLAVQTMWRGSISESPFIRGFKNREIYAQLDGQYFEPVRWDLDTVVNKIDPGIVQDTIIVAGPYSVQYGPGFTFMDIVTRPTPRNQRQQYRTSMSWLPNGNQIYGRETVSGGTQDFGYRLSYGHRNANDYQAGNRTYIPSHYNTGDVLAELGYNLSSSQRIEGSYRRQDMNHTAYPGEFFDVSSLETNAFNLRYIDEDVTAPWTRLTAQSWYNNNNMTGNTFNSTKAPIVNAVERALTSDLYPSFATPDASQNPAAPNFVGFSGATVGSITSTGGRLMAQFGELDEVSLLTGTDVRVLNQRVSEYFTINPYFASPPFPAGSLPPGLTPTPPAPPSPPSVTGTYPFQFTTGMPRATMVNPGAFAEMTLPWTSYFRSKIGGRGDYVDTNAYSNTFPTNGASNINFVPPTSALPAGPLNKANGLYAFYLVNQVDITQHWNAAFSFGESQRPPSLIDRYADGMFLGIIQSGYRRVIGDPNLQPAKNWQIDAQINGNYENWRGYLRGYNSWVNNYVTYSANRVLDPTGAVLLNTLNTPLAELRGFEAFNSFDLAPRVTPFASARYVYGTDVTINQPLTQIPPLQGFAGIRFHDPNGGRKWGLEAFATMTREQNRPGIIRITGVPGAYEPIENRVGGWTTGNLRGYWNVSQNLMVSGGINNIFNRNYIQFLSLQTAPVQVLSPGISPYMSMEWVY